jgi:hypothetical protein
MSDLSQNIKSFISSILGIFGGGGGQRYLKSSNYFNDPVAVSFIDDVQCGNVNRVKAGLAKGIDPNLLGNKGFRPIFFVFFAKSTDVLKVLLAAGANPNAVLENGASPLHFSVRNRNPEFTRILLAAGANPNGCGEYGKPHIHEALYQEGAVEQLKLLHDAGADINVVWAGATPVMNALWVGQWNPARELIDFGADLSFKDSSGKTAMDRACEFMNKLPASYGNKEGITALELSLNRRHLSLPCQDGAKKFH